MNDVADSLDVQGNVCGSGVQQNRYRHPLGKKTACQVPGWRVFLSMRGRKKRETAKINKERNKFYDRLPTTAIQLPADHGPAPKHYPGGRISLAVESRRRRD